MRIPTILQSRLQEIEDKIGEINRTAETQMQTLRDELAILEFAVSAFAADETPISPPTPHEVLDITVMGRVRESLEREPKSAKALNEELNTNYHAVAAALGCLSRTNQIKRIGTTWAIRA